MQTMKAAHTTEPRRQASTAPEMTAREKILATASDLFYREGIRAVGVDTIVENSGAAKTSLYRWFPSKDALVAAVLEDQNQQFWQWWDRVRTLRRQGLLELPCRARRQGPRTAEPSGRLDTGPARAQQV